MNVHGHCDTRFAAVEAAFRENFATRQEIGASVAVVLEGQLVVDLWAGHMDAERTRPWHSNTLVTGWSLGKAMSALTLLRVLQDQRVDTETTVASWWPEFAAAGKGDITIAQLMSHSAGLCAVEAPLPELAFYDWDLMAGALAGQAPWWEPGTAHGYHTNTFGFLLGELVRRLTGRSIREQFQSLIASPLEADFHFGVQRADLPRCADLISPPRPAEARSVVPTAPDPEDHLTNMRWCIYNNPSLSHYDTNSDAWRLAEFPSTSPQASARGVARIFGEMALAAQGDSRGILEQATLERATSIASDGNDLNLNRPTRFGLGLQLTQPDRPLGPNPGTFGHYGNGGHLGFADPAARLGFGYHMNHQGYAWRDPRNIALTDAVYASL